MAQTAFNDVMDLPADTWVLVSEVNCTFVVERGVVEILGMDGAEPSTDQRGMSYKSRHGEDAATDTLARFVGAGTADRLYMICRGRAGKVFVSREAVA